MSTIVDTSVTNVHWLTKTKTGKLAAGQGVIYITHFNKLGQATSSSYIGLLPCDVVKQRYRNGSDREKDLVITDIIVFDLGNFTARDAVDNIIRERINELHKHNKCTFKALVKNIQAPNTNGEALIGYNRREHFNELMEIIKERVGVSSKLNDYRRDFIPRFGQQSAIDKTAFNLISFNQAMLAAYASFGKTMVSLEVAHLVVPKGGIVLVTTPISDTINGFKEDLGEFGTRFGDDLTRKISIVTKADFNKGSTTQFIGKLLNRVASGELIFILLTVQDLRYQQPTSDPSKTKDNLSTKSQRKDIRKKYEALSGHIALWLRDEVHTEYDGIITKEVFSAVVADKVLDLTATPYKIADKYDQDVIVDRSLLWGIKNRKDTHLPQLSIDILSSAYNDLPATFRAVFDLEEGYNPRKFFVVDKNTVTNQLSFINNQGILDLFNKMYTCSWSKKKNPLSITNDNALSHVAKRVGLWVLPQGNSLVGAAEYIPVLADNLNSIPNSPFYIDAYTLERNWNTHIAEYRTLAEYIDKLLTSHERVIILTCEKFITGTNIPPLGHVVLMTSISDISRFEQLLGRPMRVCTGKDSIKLYALCPGIELKNNLAQLSINNASLQQNASPVDLLECISITEYVDSKPISVDPVSIIKIFQDNMKNISAPPIITIENAIITDGSSGYWNSIVNLLQSRKGPTTSVSPDNGSKVRKPTSNNKNPTVPAATHGYTDKDIASNVNVILKELIPFAYAHNIWDIEDALTLPELALLIEANNINALLLAISASANLKSILSKWLLNVKLSICALPIEAVYEKIFVNSKLKTKMGLVYVPFELANKIVSSLHPDKYNNILIINALNGTIPLMLKERFPDANIKCAECFDYFVPFLTKIGFEVIMWETLKKGSKMKFDVVIGNPPFNDSQNEKANTGNYVSASKKLHLTFIDKSLDLASEVHIVAPVRGWFVGKNKNKNFTKYLKKGLYLIENIGMPFDNAVTGEIGVFHFNKNKSFVNDGFEQTNPLDYSITDQYKMYTMVGKRTPGSLKEELLAAGTYRVILTSANIKYTNNNNLFSDPSRGNWRVAFNHNGNKTGNSIYGGKVQVAAPSDYLSMSMCCFVVESEEVARNICKYLMSDAITDLMRRIKVSCTNSKYHMSFVPSYVK